MNDNDRQKRILERLAAEDSVVEDGWRRIGTGRQQDLVLALLAEIDETVIPSALSIRNQNGGILQFQVANRRLFNIDLPLPEDLEEFQAICNAPLAGSDETTLAKSGAMVRRHLDASPYIWIRSALAMQEGSAAHTGVASGVLGVHWSSQDHGDEADKVNAFADFVENVQSCANDWILLRDGELAERAPPSQGLVISAGPNPPLAVDHSAALAKLWKASGTQATLLVTGSEKSKKRFLHATNGNEFISAEISDAYEVMLLHTWRDSGL